MLTIKDHVFCFRAPITSGRTARDVVRARDEDDARRLANEQGYTIQEIEPAKPGQSVGGRLKMGEIRIAH